MKPFFQRFSMVFGTITAFLVTACYVDDPGPLQETVREYNITNFDRLEIGDAFHIEVLHDNFYEIHVRGDRRNVDDLNVYTEGATLVVRFDRHRERRHDTFIRITMPELKGVSFSGASDSKVSGFGEVEKFDILLSGASVCQVNVDATHVDAVVSGASSLFLRGNGNVLQGDISGASLLKAFPFPVQRANLSLSGASDGEVFVSESLDVIASGGSRLVYQGNPEVTSQVTGSSSVHQY